MSEAELNEERAKARAAMARKRKKLTEEEKAAKKAQSREGMRRLRDRMSEEERIMSRNKERERQARKRMEKAAEQWQPLEMTAGFDVNHVDDMGMKILHDILTL